MQCIPGLPSPSPSKAWGRGYDKLITACCAQQVLMVRVVRATGTVQECLICSPEAHHTQTMYLATTNPQHSYKAWVR